MEILKAINNSPSTCATPCKYRDDKVCCIECDGIKSCELVCPFIDNKEYKSCEFIGIDVKI
jgi:hypothetical protein